MIQHARSSYYYNNEYVFTIKLSTVKIKSRSLPIFVVHHKYFFKSLLQNINHISFFILSLKFVVGVVVVAAAVSCFCYFIVRFSSHSVWGLVLCPGFVILSDLTIISPTKREQVVLLYLYSCTNATSSG